MFILAFITKNSLRTIPLSSALISKLSTYKLEQEKEICFAGNAYCNKGFIVANEIGHPIEPRTFQDFFKRVLRNGEVPNINFHALRHTFATRALELGVPIKTVSQILGHATVQITMDLYCHPSSEHLQESMELISSLL